MNAIQTKLLLAILALLAVIAAIEIRRNRPIQIDPVVVNKLSNAAVPPPKPYLVP